MKYFLTKFNLKQYINILNEVFFNCVDEPFQHIKEYHGWHVSSSQGFVMQVLFHVTVLNLVEVNLM